MNKIPSELKEQIRKKIRAGFPVGELREELVADGLDPVEADALLQDVTSSSAARAEGRESKITIIIGLVFLLLGALTWANGNRIGIWFVISGIIRILWTLFSRSSK